MKSKNAFNALILAAVCSILIGTITGCSSVGDVRGQTTGTQVDLNQNNYQMIKAGAIGKSSGFYLLGLIHLVSPSAASAKADLYKSVGVQLTGKAVALANQTEDRSSLYLILFSIPRLTITADVIEFTSPAQTK